jgi:uncharacterized glyoxalase superfamily protein PhnB
MRISPHLCFDGQCREATQLYQAILGGTLQTMLTYGETPMAASIFWSRRGGSNAPSVLCSPAARLKGSVGVKKQTGSHPC